MLGVIAWPMAKFLLSIDQGTTSSRTLVFSETGQVLFTAQEEFPQIYPQDGWVEHDPEAIWESTLKTLRAAYGFAAKKDGEIIGLGITNQRETTLVWDRKTGKPIYNAIVWQDRRTAQICRELGTTYEERKLKRYERRSQRPNATQSDYNTRHRLAVQLAEAQTYLC